MIVNSGYLKGYNHVINDRHRPFVIHHFLTTIQCAFLFIIIIWFGF
jgi:hypothetical protein